MNNIVSKKGIIVSALVPISIISLTFYVKHLTDKQCLRAVEEMLVYDKVPPNRIKEYIKLYK